MGNVQGIRDAGTGPTHQGTVSHIPETWAWAPRELELESRCGMFIIYNSTIIMQLLQNYTGSPSIAPVYLAY